MLEVLPPHGIDQTIHVAILIGLVLALAFTETFGWVFSGLVVPGYLASLIVIEPASAAAVTIEAVLTFVCARVISQVASRTGAWSLFFGRERFLLIIFVSIAVRQASELWLLPELASVIDERWGTTYAYSRTLSSIGLVLVPLTANAFWKVGLARGVIQVGVPTALTYAALVLVLLPHTNLSFSQLELSYENVALDFLSSPKAYILLLTGALLGSWCNLRYGWDFAGILIPALLGLAWVAPLRVVTTMAEALLLVLVVRAVVQLPVIRTINLEGPRKVVLVFGASFFLKWLVGWFAGPTVAGMPVTELFGFGYLLSSLIAVKILQKDAVGRVAVPAVVVGIVGLVSGSLVGYALDRVAPVVPPRIPELADTPVPSAAFPTTTLTTSALGVLGLGHARARLGDHDAAPLARGAGEIGRYRTTWTHLERWLSSGSEEARSEAAHAARSLGLVLAPLSTPVHGRAAWALYEREERFEHHVGWNTAVLVPGAAGPVIEVPRPVDEAPTAEASLVLCERVHCRAIVVSGVDGAVRDRGPANGIVRAALRGAPRLVLHVDRSLLRGHAKVVVASESPQVDLAALWPRSLELTWQRGSEDDGAFLYASDASYRDLVSASAPPIVERSGTSLETWLAAWDGTPPYVPITTTTPPSPSELRFLEIVLAGPLLASEDLRAGAAIASVVGYGIESLPDGAGPGAAVWVLSEARRPRVLGWGALAGRTGGSARSGSGGASITLEVPRPRREGGTLRLAAEAFRRTGARALIVADPDVVGARDDADPAAPWNVATSFHALHAAAYSASPDPATAVMLQIRGFSTTQPISDPVVVTTWRPIVGGDAPPAIASIVSASGPLGFLGPPRYHDGSRELLDLAGTGNAQLSSCRQLVATCALVWVSDAARLDLGDVERERAVATLRRQGIAVVEESPLGALIDPPLAPGPPVAITPALAARFGAAVAVAEGFARDGNPQRLRLLASQSVTVKAGFSDELGRAYVVVAAREQGIEMRAIVLVPGGVERSEIPVRGDRGALARDVELALSRRPLSLRLAGRVAEGAP